ncbi:MAG: hypothetical protein K2N63_17820 [Lachnospiraceae bacterium]|nr:hypothetical protein [Lachnospiraceae bacterium]
MVVALTEGISGQLGTTLHTALFALWLAYEEKKDCLVMSVQPGRRDLEAYLTGGKKRYKSHPEEGTGIEALRKLVKAGFADREGIRECVTELGGHLSLLPEQFYNTGQRTLRDYREDIPRMLLELEKHYDYILCDVGDERGGLAPEVIGDAGLLVRNIGQNTKGFLQCFKESGTCYPGKTIFYLLGCYDAESKYNMHNLRYSYRELNLMNSACLPYCTEIRDACLDGKLLHLFEKWQKGRAGAALTDFFGSLKKAARRMQDAGRGGMGILEGGAYIEKKGNEA